MTWLSRRLHSVAALLAHLAAGSASADTLRAALVSTCRTNPTITGQREALRATDANVAIESRRSLERLFMGLHSQRGTQGHGMRRSCLPNVRNGSKADIPFRACRGISVKAQTINRQRLPNREGKAASSSSIGRSRAAMR